ncbi:phage portal protein [Rosenbergiella epipactidis]|uniref:phage portal protein n=1 Tax=Rosenbergiella epipactidis TaxID=1544694 RepID=UPI001F4F2CFE|nr:phage portal protein [Rosenbergiella epipactidis]
MSNTLNGVPNASALVEGESATECFTFGDPIPVLDRREILDYVECGRYEHWYEPPVSFDGLTRTFRSAVHHSSPIQVKRNILISSFIPHKLLSRQTFSSFLQDYLVFGNAYLEKRTNHFGEVISLMPSLAKFTCRGLDLESYWFIGNRFANDYYLFSTGSVFHLMEPDLNQEISGFPEYLSAIPSALLNEAATLFRRKYYVNGSHAGYIMYMTDAAQNQEDINSIRQAIKAQKDQGIFETFLCTRPTATKTVFK